MNDLFKFVFCICASVFLCSCSNSKGSSKIEDSLSESTITTVETVIAETAITTEYDKKEFSGFQASEMCLNIGNSMSCLNQSGLIYTNENISIYNDDKGDLISQYGMEKTVLVKSVNARCINVVNDKVYYISANGNNRVYTYDLITAESDLFIDDDISFLLMLEDMAVYEDNDHKLYLYNNGITTTISDRMVLWVDVFGNSLIYTEVNGNNAEVRAVDLDTNEDCVVLDYGFSPAIYANFLYYQDREGEISRMNLYSGECEKYLSEWGQQFCMTGDQFYYISSKGICSRNGIVYNTENADYSLSYLFVCGNQLYFAETNDTDINLYRFDPDSNEKELIE